MGQISKCLNTLQTRTLTIRIRSGGLVGVSISIKNESPLSNSSKGLFRLQRNRPFFYEETLDHLSYIKASLFRIRVSKAKRC